jgi:peptide/nickel transport system substrate-binding protein
MTHRCPSVKNATSVSAARFGAATRCSILLILIAAVGGCRAPANRRPAPATLTIGYGQVTDNPQSGMQQVAALLSMEGLAILGDNGRANPLLAAGFSQSDDGRKLQIALRPSVKFHDGTPVDAHAVKAHLDNELKKALGPVGKDIRGVRVVSDRALEVDLVQRSNFIEAALELSIHSPKANNIGTGPFYVVNTSPAGIELAANEEYYLGAPAIQKVSLKPYDSFRGAWADMLRGQVDMLYETGPDALDLKPGSNVRVFTSTRHYAYLILLNLRKGQFRSATIRHALNQAINRPELVAEGLKGHGRVVEGPAWPDHWAHVSSSARFEYAPAEAQATVGRTIRGRPLRFTCVVASSQPYERLALAVQRQLKAVGVEMALEAVSTRQFASRLTSGDFEAMLGDARIAPTLFQEYQWWYSDGPRNFTGYKSATVDAALDAVRGAPDEASYKRGVAEFERAIVEDPPAIFLAWAERARAVSTKFQVPAELGRDVFSSIRLFKPVTDVAPNGRN